MQAGLQILYYEHAHYDVTGSLEHGSLEQAGRASTP